MFAATRVGVMTEKASAFRYWRLFVDAAGGTDYISISELELFSVAGGSDITTPSTPASASSEFSASYAASKAIDNLPDAQSVWLTPAGKFTNEWLLLDLGTPKAVAQIKIYPPTSVEYRSPKDFKLQHSSDATTFTTVLTVTNQTGWTTPRTFTVP